MNEEQKNSVTGEERAAVREGGSGERVMTNKMGTMPMNKLLLSMALPMMISMLVQALYNIVDSVFVSMINEKDVYKRQGGRSLFTEPANPMGFPGMWLSVQAFFPPGRRSMYRRKGRIKKIFL